MDILAASLSPIDRSERHGELKDTYSAIDCVICVADRTKITPRELQRAAARVAGAEGTCEYGLPVLFTLVFRAGVERGYTHDFTAS